MVQHISPSIATVQGTYGCWCLVCTGHLFFGGLLLFYTYNILEQNRFFHWCWGMGTLVFWENRKAEVEAAWRYWFLISEDTEAKPDRKLSLLCFLSLWWNTLTKRFWEDWLLLKPSPLSSPGSPPRKGTISYKHGHRPWSRQFFSCQRESKNWPRQAHTFLGCPYKIFSLKGIL